MLIDDAILCYEAGSRLADWPASGRVRLRLRSPLQSCWLHATPAGPTRRPRTGHGTGQEPAPPSPAVSAPVGSPAAPLTPTDPPAGPWTAVRVTRHHGPSNVCAAARQHVVVKLNAARPVVLVRVRAGRQVLYVPDTAARMSVCWLLLAYHAVRRRARARARPPPAAG